MLGFLFYEEDMETPVISEQVLDNFELQDIDVTTENLHEIDFFYPCFEKYLQL
jgi:hypothetical protein